MIRRNFTYKIIIILVLTVSGLLIPTKDSYASNPTIIGFIIKASQMEGTIQDLKMITGNTAAQKDRPMLELKFKNLSAKDLIIKKLVKTPEGIITIDMNPKDVVFNNLSIKVTNAEFNEPYLPSNGNIGLKKVTLLAHRVTADSSILPQFHLGFNEGGQVEMEPKSEEELLQLKEGLEQLLNVSQQ